MKTGRFGGQPKRPVFRCEDSPDLLAILQGNPGQPTPFFASVSTLAVLAIRSNRILLILGISEIHW